MRRRMLPLKNNIVIYCEGRIGNDSLFFVIETGVVLEIESDDTWMYRYSVNSYYI